MPFILDGLDTEAYDRNYSDRELLRRISVYFKPHSRKLLFVAFMITLNSLAGTVSPILISKAIDIVRESPSISAMELLSLGVLLLGAAAWGFNFVRQYISAQIVGNVVLQLRGDVFNAAIRHDLSFYDENPSGKIVSRVTSDTQDFSNVVTLVVDVLSQILLVCLLLIWVANIDLKLTLIVLALAPSAFVLALSFRKLARRVSRNARRVTAKINALIQESISGITVAKSFRQERAIYDGFAEGNRQAYKVGLVRGFTMKSIFPIMGMGSGLAIGIVAYAGGIATQSGGITPGNWYLFMQSVWFLWWPLISIASFWSQFQDGLSASERVFALIDAEPKVKQKGNKKIERLSGKIEFRNINFAYNEAESVLSKFSLSVSSGETLALVGHTGAGKSSIARLIARFYEYQGGDILIDDHDIRSLALTAFRQQIGFVPQSPYLFAGSVGENIHYGLPNAKEVEIHGAVKRIAGGTWLEDFPEGLETDVGTRGSSLSMGQRQLIALARVLLKDPPIFLLDEATASVDPFTEAQIQEGLDTVMRDRTAVVIAHRLSTIKRADRIIVLQSGEILEEGRHQPLLDLGGLYAELYNTYFRHQSLEYIESTPG